MHSVSEAVRLKERNLMARKALYMWFAVSIFCAVFAAIYEHFSFGVYSASMVFMFLYPLVLGAGPALLLRRAGSRLWNDGVILLTVSSLIRGVLEIYGTDSPMTFYMTIAGVGLLAVGLVR